MFGDSVRCLYIKESYLEGSDENALQQLLLTEAYNLRNNCKCRAEKLHFLGGQRKAHT